MSGRNIVGLFVLGVLAALAGCTGGGDSDSGNTRAVSNGVFVDSPVQGVRFETATQSGFTDASGAFQYIDGETVSFYIGDILLGAASGAAQLTPIDFVSAAIDETHPQVTNILRFVQTLDEDNDTDNGIVITSAVFAQAAGLNVDFAVSIAEFENSGNVQTVIADLTASLGAARTLIDSATAQAHLRDSLNAVPFFETPFDAEFPAANLFDHDVPLQFVDTNGYTVDHDGVQRNVGAPGASIDGHEGHDWLLPMGTGVKAVAVGQVVFAGEVTGPCPVFPGSPDVVQKEVHVQHTAPNGDLYLSRYAHLSAISVAVGASVSVGEDLGTSGNTGCSTQPHLHFQVYRWLAPASAGEQWVTVDPYGWTAAAADPWSQHPSGTSSSRLWKPGQAPALLLQ